MDMQGSKMENESILCTIVLFLNSRQARRIFLQAIIKIHGIIIK